MLHTIETPETLNAATLRGLRAKLEAVDGGVVVLRGRQASFCNGIDLAALVASSEVDAALTDFASCLLAIRAAPAPVIAVVEGVALGGGLGLAAAADVIVAGPRARFGLPEVVFGFSPAMILPAIEERLGAQAARRLALSPGTIDAESARAMGLVDELTPSVEEATALLVRNYRRVTTAGARAVKTHPYSFARFAAGVREGHAMTRAALADPALRARLTDFMEGGALPWG